MKDCRCNPILEPFEFPIIDKNDDLDIHIEDYFPNQSNLCELKEKIIYDFCAIISKLNCGIQPNLEFLLEEISMVYIYDE